MQYKTLLAALLMLCAITMGCSPPPEEPDEPDAASDKMSDMISGDMSEMESENMLSAVDMPEDMGIPSGCTQAIINGELDGICHWECEEYDQDCSSPIADLGM